VAVGLTIALAWSKLSERVPIPAAAFFLIAGATLSDISLRSRITPRSRPSSGSWSWLWSSSSSTAECTFGWRRFRSSAVRSQRSACWERSERRPSSLPAATWLLGLSWMISGLIGAALAPTDPAVMFSVLGQREVGGRTDTILEGESGANDPVGIALMLAMIQFATASHGSDFHGRAGVRRSDEHRARFRDRRRPPARPADAVQVAERGPLPHPHSCWPAESSTGLPAWRTARAFSPSSWPESSSVTERVPFKTEIEAFHSSLASLAEVAAFGGLGLTVDLAYVGPRLDLAQGSRDRRVARPGGSPARRLSAAHTRAP